VKVGYYPGCSLEGTAREFGISVEKSCELLGIELVDLDDWSCCGATAAHNTSRLLSVALPGRNLALAEQQGLDKLLAPCAACSNRLIAAHKEMTENETLRSEIAEIIEMPYSGSVKVLNYLELIVNYGIEDLESKVTRKLADFKVACYYGCLLVRPPKIVEFDDAENPQSMDRIVTALGAEAVDWEYKVECCGGGFTISDPKLVETLAHDILENAEVEGANAIAVACPLCHANLDMKQPAINARFHEKRKMPVFYVSELVALGCGATPEEAGINKHFVDSYALIK
jgi:heterodisulfide reductase subunit B